MGTTATQHIADEVKAARGRRGWTQADLARRLNELGGVGWNQSKIAKLERRKTRPVSVDELLLLAAAFNVAPMYLFAREGDIAITPRLSAPARLARRWVSGFTPLPGEDALAYYADVPLEERGRVEQAVIRLALEREHELRGGESDAG